MLIQIPVRTIVSVMTEMGFFHARIKFSPFRAKPDETVPRVNLYIKYTYRCINYNIKDTSVYCIPTIV